MASPTAAAPGPNALLDRALRGDPARALLTFYDDATGERTELSVATFANWVAKTAHLCRDGLGLEVGDRVAIALPCHWQAAVWWQAAWLAGLVVVTPGAAGAGQVEATVLAAPWPADAPGPEPAPRSGEVVALGLAPMGLPRPGAAPSGAVDYDREIHGHGDRFVPPPGLGPDTPALESAAGALTAATLGERVAGAAARWGLAPGERLLTAAPLAEPADLVATLLVPLLGDVGAVLCRHLEAASQDTLARRVQEERVTAVTQETRFRLPGTRPLD
ncbi:MAG: hypothetical protein QOI54_1422 [Actinomycetota bacterium]|jgi:uncharacterized protein (TIGR03089 family)|nr:hypothetical protein [Actinomycetota bacterium]